MEKILVISDSLVTFKVIERMLGNGYEVSLSARYDENKVNSNDTVIIDSSLYEKSMLPSSKKFIVMVNENYMLDDFTLDIVSNGGEYIMLPLNEKSLKDKI